MSTTQGRAEDIIERLHSLYPKLIDLSLDRLERLLIALGRHPSCRPIINPLLVRLGRVIGHITTIMARFAAGSTPRRPDLRRNRARPAPTNPRPKYPTEHGWLLDDLKHEVAFFRAKLEELLDEPGVAELLAAIPHIHRILNPIRSALALPTHPPRHIPRRRPPPPPPPITAEALSYLWPFRNLPPHLRLKPT